MADLISTLTTDIQAAFADLTTTNAERYFNQIHNMVLHETGIRDTTADISLTAGTRYYTLAEASVLVKAAYYLYSSANDDHKYLIPTTEDWMDLNAPGWRNRSARGVPSRFFMSSGKSTNNTIKQIGFDPIPETTTSASYPTVRTYITQNVTLVSTDTIPVELSCSLPYLDGSKWLHCKNTRRDAEAAYWHDQFRKSLDYEKQYMKNRVRNAPTALNLAGWVKGASVT